METTRLGEHRPSVSRLGLGLAALGVGWTDELEAWLGELRMSPADYWSSRSLLPWN